MRRKEKDKLLKYVKYVLEDKIKRLDSWISLLQYTNLVLGSLILIGIGMSIAGSFEGELLAIFSFFMICVFYDLEKVWRERKKFFMQFVEEVERE